MIINALLIFHLQEDIRPSSVQRIVTPSSSSTNHSVVALPSSQRTHHHSTHSYHSDTRAESDGITPRLHSHSRQAMTSPHRNEHPPAPSVSTPSHLHQSPHTLVHNPGTPHQVPRVHHHSVHHPQPHYHMQHHYHTPPPFQMRPSYLSSQAPTSVHKEDSGSQTKNEEMNGSAPVVSPREPRDETPDSDQGLPMPPLAPVPRTSSGENSPTQSGPRDPSSPYHPVRRRGEAAALIDIAQGKKDFYRDLTDMSWEIHW